MTVGEKIRALRLKENWSQIQLAAELGVSETTIRNYEAGRVGVRERHLQKLSKIFSVDTSVLGGDHAETYNDVMQMLFMLADEYGLSTTDIAHVPPDDTVLVFNKRVLQNYLNAWHKKKIKAEEDNEPADLIDWELHFPTSLADTSEKTIKEERKNRE